MLSGCMMLFTQENLITLVQGSSLFIKIFWNCQFSVIDKFRCKILVLKYLNFIQSRFNQTRLGSQVWDIYSAHVP